MTSLDSRAELDALPTGSLFALIRGGNRDAIAVLMERYRPRLRRYAAGHVPSRLRSVHNTEDLVQDTLVKVLAAIEDFEPRHEAAFFCFLRTTLQRHIIDLVRKAGVRPTGDTLPPDVPDPPRQEDLAAYNHALSRLSERQRAAVILRIEFCFTYREITEELGFPSPNAARMFISRALLALTEVMHVRGSD